MTTEQAKKILSRRRLDNKHRNHREGRHCVFIRLSAKWGAKVYWHPDSCLQQIGPDAYRRQLMAYQHGLAPMVGPAFTMQDKSGDRYFVYLTQIVQVADTNEHSFVRYGDRFIKRELRPDLDTLFASLRRIGISIDYDELLYAPNVGVDGDRLVAIDFGP